MADSPFLTTTVRELLSESFRGREAGPVWFLDDEGLLATVRGMPAEQASRRVAPGGATIAGHVEHVRWFLAVLNAYARGERPEMDWDASWTVDEVDEERWLALVESLEAAWRELDGHLGRGIDAEDERLKPILATVVHVGYHVGAVRQMARCVA